MPLLHSRGLAELFMQSWPAGINALGFQEGTRRYLRNFSSSPLFWKPKTTMDIYILWVQAWSSDLFQGPTSWTGELGPLCVFGVEVEGGREKWWGMLVPAFCAKIDRSESQFMPGTRESMAQVFSWKWAQSFLAQIGDGNEVPVVKGGAS